MENSSTKLHQQLVKSWCERNSFARVFSHGEYFLCPKQNHDAVGNLKGVVLKVGMITGGDFEYDCSSVVENGRLKPKDSYSQYILTILQEIFQFDVQFVGANSWGYYEEFNHTWKGLAGLLASNATDMAACHWTATEQLTHIADYLFSTAETTESFVYLPQNLPLTQDVFVAAFTRKLWLFFLLSIFLLIASFGFSTYMHSRVRPDHEPWSWDEVVLWAVAAISQQSYSRHPRGSSCRTMFLIGYLITYLLYTGFTASITSLLALQSHQNQLTLSQVADMKLHLILHRDEYYLDFFEGFGTKFGYLNIRRSEGENLRQIFYKIKQTNFLGFGSTVALLHYLRKKVNPDNRHNFLVVPVPNSTRRKAFLVRKSFPYKSLFNYWLLRLRENGLLDLGKKRYLKTEEAVRFQVTKWFSAGLGNVFSAVAFLFAGWIASASVLFAEILCKKKSNKIKTKLI